MRKSLSTVLAAAVLAATSVGCVTQQTYDELDAAYRKSQEQLVEAQAEIERLRQQIALQDPSDERNRIAELQQQLADAQAKLTALTEDYNRLASEAGKAGGPVIVVDAETDKALREWAAQNADIAEYDPARGMVKLRSDLTFALGSDSVTNQASATLQRLAGVLNGAASEYEIRIVGHTDAVPISRAATKAKHPTNWHLGAHRAIAVKDTLDKAGVSPVRIGISSYAMYRPTAANARGGTEANRRVEIYLTRMPPVNEAWINAGAGGAAPAPAPREAEGDIPLK